MAIELFRPFVMKKLVEDGVANALAELEEKGCKLIDKARRKGAEGLNIAFLHPKSTMGTLVELCEDPKKK